MSFWRLQFFQKTNKNNSTWGIIVVTIIFFWKNWGYQKVLLKLTDFYCTKRQFWQYVPQLGIIVSQGKKISSKVLTLEEYSKQLCFLWKIRNKGGINMPAEILSQNNNYASFPKIIIKYAFHCKCLPSLLFECVFPLWINP